MLVLVQALQRVGDKNHVRHSMGVTTTRMNQHQHQVGHSVGHCFCLSDVPCTKIPANDLFVDGFVSCTFGPGDANNYLMLLLRTQHFVPYYGIVYHQGAWHITRNAQYLQGTSPGVPPVANLPLDYDMRETHGTIVPQRRWTPADEIDFRRHVEDAVLQLPIFFANRNGGIGFWLPDILRGCDRDILNGGSFAALGGKASTQVRINVSQLFQSVVIIT